ncbi:hypothetical protein A2803_01515 [Candidatus Woesebacteria bacterium RIFCSPHIGHO2_01_FULL_44_21]|uniref:Uncharacterized protein n=1 Tax=Candidatus Woesebacteria bacterium RIFCSPHIGHO2_01_FULL_44_21 TaxID=1802503 RepID=A0A1F7YZU9_9BACT|nr:MAG: hypothetical protein A2803_01515 [Candidatus Woesebacteria bacterium RIFCSPHIGHO2_01_FULL_44_21]
MTFLSTVFAGSGSLVIRDPGIGNISGFTLTNIVSWAVTAIIVIAGLIFFFMLIIGGLRWILSGGDKAATESARGQITAALIGLVIVFSAWAIAQLIQAVFGVEILNLTIPAIGQGGS